MSYDLALNRIDHDLMFHASTDAPPASVTSWARTIWDEGRTRWDLKEVQVNKFMIWPIAGADKVAQQIKINLLSFLGEWFLDTDYGVPYLEQVLVKNPRMAAVETILRRHINSVPDVVRIDSLVVNWDRQARLLRVEFTCLTHLGPVTESVQLEMNRNV
jgi:hypothetical protein